VTPASRPRLARKARLRRDRQTGQHLLLYPERGLLLNATASAIVALCTGEHTLDEIVARAAEGHEGDARRAIALEVEAFLERLAERGLVEVAP
jgi:pyrroloquinoline quinone biosynthesis protein D